MSTEENKALARRAYEQLNSRNIDRADEVFDATIVDHTPGLQVAPGLEGWKEAARAFVAGFPDLHIEIEDILAEGDRVVVRATVRGTHGGQFFGVPPTNRPVTVAEMDIWRVANGKIVEHWGQLDALGILQQLGVVPEPQAAGA